MLNIKIKKSQIKLKKYIQNIIMKLKATYKMSENQLKNMKIICKFV